MWRSRFSICMVFLLLLGGCSYPENQEWTGGGTGGDGDEPGDKPVSVVSVKHLKSFYKGHPYTFAENYRIKGVVVSTDRSGNYHKTLVVRDETGAMELKLDADDLFQTYFMGCIVEVACNELTIGAYSGLLQLGSSPSQGHETGYIAEEDVSVVMKIVGASESAVEPEKRTITNLTGDDVSRFIAIDGVQFVKESLGVLWCDEAPEESTGFKDTDRYVIDQRGNRLLVRTSRYAECASWSLPEGSGTIEGILSLFNGNYQLRVIRPDILYSSMTAPRF